MQKNARKFFVKEGAEVVVVVRGGKRGRRPV